MILISWPEKNVSETFAGEVEDRGSNESLLQNTESYPEYSIDLFEEKWEQIRKRNKKIAVQY